MIFDEGEIIHECAWPKNITPPHTDVVTLISDPNHIESVINIHTFQVEDDLMRKIYPNLKWIHSLPNPASSNDMLFINTNI